MTENTGQNQKQTLRLEGEEPITLQVTMTDDYYPMDDYAANGYLPFGPRKCHFCRACIDYYQGMYDKGITEAPFMIQCNGDISATAAQIDPDEFGDGYDYYRVLQDPVAWAEFEFQWFARWYQKEILRCSAQFKALRAGRRIGKTECMAILALWYLFTNGGLDNRQFEVLVIAPYQMQVTKVFDILRSMIKRSSTLSMPGVVKKDTQNPQIIEFESGGKILGLSSGAHSGAKSDKIRGQSADLIIIDEVDYVNDTDIEVIMAILASHADCRLIVASTPRGVRQKLHQWCFPADTMVLTPSGSVPIQDLRVGDSVLSASGHPEYITKTYERDSQDDLTVLRLKKTHVKLSSTANHPHLAILKPSGNYKPRFVPASELRPGDYVGVTLPDSKYVGIPYVQRPNDEYTDRRFLDHSFDMKRFVNEGYDGCRDRRILGNLDKADTEVDRLNSNPQLAKKFMELLGIYIAEGNIIPKNRGIQLSFAKNEPLSYTAETLINDLWPDVNVTRSNLDNGKGQWTQLMVHGTWLAHLFRTCGSEYSHKKAIHPSLLCSPYIMNLISKYHEGDGCISEHGAKSYDTTSPVLADQVWRTLLSHGIQASVYTGKLEGKKRFYTIYELKKDTNQIKWYGRMPFLEIARTDQEAHSGTVYNLETSGSHTYSANGFATHNCTEKNLGYKEFWFVSSESPSWTSDTESVLRSMYTQSGFSREFFAEFGEEMEGVFRSSDIAAALASYDLKDCRYHPQNKYMIGVDWNKTTGTHIVVVEALHIDGGPFKYRLVDKQIIRKDEFQQIEAVKAIMYMDKKWGGKTHMYVDAGYGAVQVEMMWKYDVDHPTEKTNYHDRVVPVTMNMNRIIRDPVTGEERKKQVKQFMVDTSARALENKQVILPKSEDTALRVIPEELPYASIGLVQQMRQFTVTKYSPTGVPTYSQEYEHTLTAWMLAMMGHLEVHSDINKVHPVMEIAYAEGMGVGDSDLKYENIPGVGPIGRQTLAQISQEAKDRAKELKPPPRVHEEESHLTQPDAGSLIAGIQSMKRYTAKSRTGDEREKRNLGRKPPRRGRRTNF